MVTMHHLLLDMHQKGISHYNERVSECQVEKNKNNGVFAPGKCIVSTHIKKPIFAFAYCIFCGLDKKVELLHLNFVLLDSVPFPLILFPNSLLSPPSPVAGLAQEQELL